MARRDIRIAWRAERLALPPVRFRGEAYASALVLGVSTLFAVIFANHAFSAWLGLLEVLR